MKTPPRKEIAGYLLTDFLGAGNSASVFKAIKDEQNIAAVKIRLVGNSNYENLLYQRFFEGARLQYFCNHPNIAFLHQYIEEQEMQAILIEYLPGGSLSNRIKKFGPLSFEDLIKLGIYLADALNHLEDLSIIHRDIKTDNLLFADIKKIESIKLLDFDVAKHFSSKPITEKGTQIGTMWYMSPEQFCGHPVDHLSDLYALGIVLFECACGKLPFKSLDSSVFFRKVLDQEPMPMLQEYIPNVHPLLNWLLSKVLAYYPLQRVPNASTFAVLLMAIAQIENIDLDYERMRYMLLRANQSWIAQHLNQVPKHYRSVLDRVLNALFSNIR